MRTARRAFGSFPASSLSHGPFPASAFHPSSIASSHYFASELLNASAANMGSPAGTVLVTLPCPSLVLTPATVFSFSLHSHLVLDRVKIGDRPHDCCSSSAGHPPLLSGERIPGLSLLADDSPAPSRHSIEVVPPGSSSGGVGGDPDGAGG